MLSFTVSGTNSNGCAASGSGQTQHLHNPVHPDLGTLTLFFHVSRSRGVYNASDWLPPSFKYDVLVSCPGQNPFTLKAPLNLCQDWRWITSDGERREFPDPGLTQLRGNNTTNCFGNTAFSWNLLPDAAP